MCDMCNANTIATTIYRSNECKALCGYSLALMGQTYGTNLWDKLMGQTYGTNLWDKLMGQILVTFYNCIIIIIIIIIINYFFFKNS